MTRALAMTSVEPALMHALRTPRLQGTPPREGRRDPHPIVAFTP